MTSARVGALSKDFQLFGLPARIERNSERSFDFAQDDTLGESLTRRLRRPEVEGYRLHVQRRLPFRREMIQEAYSGLRAMRKT
jgi:hypothetical protein